MIHQLPVLLLLLAAGPQTDTKPAPGTAAQGSSTQAPTQAPAETPAETPAEEPPKPARQPRAVLEDTRERLLSALFETSPWLAYRRAWPSVPEGLGRYDPDSETWWSYVLESSAADLASIRPESLPDDLRQERDWLTTWVRAESTLAFSRNSHRWNPADYVIRAQRVLECVAESPLLTPDQRLERAFQVLDQLPQLWDTARHGLLSPSSDLSAEAIQRLLDLGVFLERTLPEHLKEATWTPDAKKRFDQVLREDLRQCLRFRSWLSEAPLRAGGPIPPMDARNWETIVQQLTGTQLDVPALKAKLLREVSTCDRRLGTRRALPEVSDEELTQRAVRQHVREATRTAVELGGNAHVFEGLAVPWADLVPDATQSAGSELPGPLVRAWPTETGERLIFETAGKTWPPAQRTTRDGRLSQAAQRALAIRYGVPGEALLRRAASRNDSRVERYLWNRAVIEGWGLYALDLSARISWVDNPLRKDEAFQAEATRIFLVEASRLLASLEVNAQRSSIQDAAEAFAQRTGFDELTSFYEVRRVVEDPLTGIGYVVLLELRALENDYAVGADRGAAVRQILAALLERPSRKPSDLRALLMRGSER